MANLHPGLLRDFILFFCSVVGQCQKSSVICWHVVMETEVNLLHMLQIVNKDGFLICNVFEGFKEVQID